MLINYLITKSLSRASLWLLVPLWGLAFFLFLASPPLAQAAPEKLPEIGQPYGWWYSQGGMPGGGGGRGGGGGGRGVGAGAGERSGRGGGGGGGGRPGGAPPGTGVGRPPVFLLMGVSGAALPETAPEVYYRLTPRTRDGLGDPVVLKAKVSQSNDTWKAEFSPYTGGLAEVYSSFELAGRHLFSQINIQVSGVSENSPSDPEAAIPQDWPRFVLPEGPDGLPIRSLMIGQKLDFSLLGTAADQALTVQELGIAPPEPLSLVSEGNYTYTADEEQSDQLESFKGRQVVFVVIPKEGPGPITFSLSVTRPRMSQSSLRNSLVLASGSGFLTMAGVLVARRGFKYRHLNKKIRRNPNNSQVPSSSQESMDL